MAGYVLRGTHVGHTAPVTCLALDANFLFSGSDDATIRMWDAMPARRPIRGAKEGPSGDGAGAGGVDGSASGTKSGELFVSSALKVWDGSPHIRPGAGSLGAPALVAALPRPRPGSTVLNSAATAAATGRNLVWPVNLRKFPKSGAISEAFLMAPPNCRHPSSATELANEQSEPAMQGSLIHLQCVPHRLKGPSTEHQLQQGRATSFMYSPRLVAICQLHADMTVETVSMSDL
eukprot:363265-Chlamydomonas_euryale.AAC.6